MESRVPPIPPAVAPKPPAAPRPSVEGSVKDTIEAILVAFMLAFIFRAFVVEAFVIPTGSMAPTLLGAHMRFRCPDCGYRFDVNYSSRDDNNIPTVAKDWNAPIYCPNCGYQLPGQSAADPDNDTRDVSVRYGDRILVLKFLYIFQEPKRWDVVVFKSPHDPGVYDYSQNYIKRLIGKPGESIMILDGDIYVGKGNDVNSFAVQPKPRKVQEALWRIVYDNDFIPHGLDRTSSTSSYQAFNREPVWMQPWQALPGQNGWNLGDPKADRRTFTFSNPSGAASILFNAAANPSKYALTDWLAYDVVEPPPDNNVSDVKLEFTYDRREGAGPLHVQLSKFKHEFEARIDAGQASLLMDGAVVDGPKPLPRQSGPMHVEFSNVDYRVSLFVDDTELLATKPEQYHPDIPALLDLFRNDRRSPPKPDVRITAEQQTCELRHVQLWRDVYYLNRSKPNQYSSILWGGPPGSGNGPVQLKDDEFFVMGDNSLVSLDARYWKDPIILPQEELNVDAGRVPRRFMLGKAFFVYWPAGFRPVDAAPAIVPDFGDMRFIH